MLNACACTGNLNDPSSRFRIRQYIPALEKYGIKLIDLPTAAGRYPPGNKSERPWWGIKNIAQHVPKMLKTYHYDLTIMQREFMSTFLTLESFSHSPRIVDMDDAIFLYRGGRAARRLAEISRVVVCGNDYIAEWAGRWNRSVEIVPTAVNTDRYRPINAAADDSSLLIGWTGTSGNLEYLYAIEPALVAISGRFPKVIFRIVCDLPPTFKMLGGDQVDFVRWSEENEIAAIQGMNIGIMPLPDTPWARGKCSYKMLQYMACGIPVVVSPVGMNQDVLSQGEIGFAASTHHEWIEVLSTLLDDKTARGCLGGNARKLVEARYSHEVIVPRLASIFNAAVG